MLDHQITQRWRASLNYLRYNSRETAKSPHPTICLPAQWYVDTTQVGSGKSGSWSTNLISTIQPHYRLLVDMNNNGNGSLGASCRRRSDTVISQQPKALFRAEGLNAFHTLCFRGPNMAFGNAAFGQIASQGNCPRMIQLGLRLYF